jgi:2-hydroxy-3-keto-5-methylthiopentenyl-1-phosphate phosphatase
LVKLEKILKIFCDFDGTITYQDVWLEIGNCFIEDKKTWHEVISSYESGEIGSRECFMKEIELIGNFDKKMLDEIIDRQIIEHYFIDFVKFCKEKKLELILLSEGVDYYINRILQNNGLDLPFYTNKFVISEDESSINLEFPFSDAECSTCGCCKRNLLLNLIGDDEISVYIGDGLSDIYAVKYADIIFAKKTLASYCWKNNITYFDYNDFSDIRKKLEKIITSKKIKPRQSARLMRRDAYLGG